jgi:hypothetical protein
VSPPERDAYKQWQTMAHMALPQYSCLEFEHLNGGVLEINGVAVCFSADIAGR